MVPLFMHIFKKCVDAFWGSYGTKSVIAEITYFNIFPRKFYFTSNRFLLPWIYEHLSSLKYLSLQVSLAKIIFTGSVMIKSNRSITEILMYSEIKKKEKKEKNTRLLYYQIIAERCNEWHSTGMRYILFIILFNILTHIVFIGRKYSPSFEPYRNQRPESKYKVCWHTPL